MLKIDFWNILINVINIIILFVAFRIFLFKPVNNIIKKREEAAGSIMDEARNTKEEAEELKSDYEDKLEELESNRQDMMDEAQKNADDEYKRVLGNAEKEAHRVKQEAEEAARKEGELIIAKAKEEKADILREAEKNIADMVVHAAIKVAGNQFDDSDVNAYDSALYDEFIKKAGDKK